MSAKVTWLGHGTWLVDSGKDSILIDPFLDDSPTSPVKSKDVSPNYILVSHGHSDHVSDCAKIAKRTGALVISNFEICTWLANQGVKHTHPHNLGGGSNHSFGRVKLTLAHHSSTLPDGTNGGNPSGFLLALKEGNLYFACDTSLFLDMQLIGKAGLELAVLPIGDQFTMGPDDAIEAIKLLNPRRVAPSHFNTWPPIAQDAQAFAARVQSETGSSPVLLSPGESITIP